MKYPQEIIDAVVKCKKQGMKHRDISEKVFGKRSAASSVWNILDKHYYNGKLAGKIPNILTLDIETSPHLVYAWGLFNENIGLNRVVREGRIMSWAAKWAGNDEVTYTDNRGHPVEHDCNLDELWRMLDKADIVVVQNGIKFDIKKINAAFLRKGYKPPKPYKVIDTYQIARSKFGFMSNKLEHMTEQFNTHYKKQDHGKFPGFALWTECLKGNEEAWDEMERYNKYDVLATEELAFKLAPYATNLPNLDLYYLDGDNHCLCGSTDWEENGYVATGISMFRNFTCQHCGAHKRGRVNLVDKEQRKTLKVNSR